MRDFVFGFFTCFFIFVVFIEIRNSNSLTQLNNKYSNEGAVYEEFQNVFLNVQPKKFKVVNSTPILSNLKDKEVVVFSSGTSKLMWRDNQEIYAVSGSCVTVIR